MTRFFLLFIVGFVLALALACAAMPTNMSLMFNSGLAHPLAYAIAFSMAVTFMAVGVSSFNHSRRGIILGIIWVSFVLLFTGVLYFDPDALIVRFDDRIILWTAFGITLVNAFTVGAAVFLGEKKQALI